MFYLAKYNTQTVITFPLIKRGVVDLATSSDYTPAAADSSITKDQGTTADTANTVTAITGGGTRSSVLWKLTLSATELSAAEIVIQIVDAATKAVEDQTLIVYTYGNASAKIPFDLSTAALTAAAIATGVWQDTTAADFTTALSVGKSVMNGVSLGTGLTVAAVSGAVGSVTGAVGSVTGAVGSVASAGITRASLAADTGLQPSRSNTAQAGAGSSITLDASASAVDSFYKGMMIYLTGATGAGQSRLITAYVGSTMVATVTPAWATNPDATSTFAVVESGAADVEAWLGAVAPANTGDAFARLGAPAGASVSADVAAAKADTAAVKVQTDKMVFTVSGYLDVNAYKWVGGTIPAVNVTGVPLVDAKYLLGTIFATPATAGIMDINLKNIANAAVSTSSAQIGVNAVNIGGTAQTGRDIGGAVPAVAAGASGGLLISGSNSGTTTLAALTVTGATTHTGNVVLSDGLTISAPSTLNRAGLSVTGNGTGAGVIATGGGTGIGLNVVGGGTSGDGIKVTTTSGHGMNLAPVGTSMHGLLATGGNGGTSDGIKGAAGTGGVDIRGNITGNLVGTVSTLTTYTGNTPQTGDVYALANGTSGFVATKVDTAAVKVQTDKMAFTGANKIDASVRDWVGDTIPARSVTGVPKVDVQDWVGGAVPAVNVTGVPLVDLKYTLGTISPATAGSVRADAVTGAVGSVTGAVGSVTGAVGSVTGAVGSVTGNVGGNVVGSVASVTAAVTITASSIQAIWDALTSALTTVGSIGKLLVTNIDAAISSRSTYAGGDTSGTTTLLGRLTATRAGDLDNLDAAVSTRLATSGYTAPPSAATIAAAVWATVTEGTYTALNLMRGMAAMLIGKVSGGQTGTEVFRAADDSKDRVTMTDDSTGNRSNVTLDLS